MHNFKKISHINNMAYILIFFMSEVSYSKCSKFSINKFWHRIVMLDQHLTGRCVTTENTYERLH